MLVLTGTLQGLYTSRVLSCSPVDRSLQSDRPANRTTWEFILFLNLWSLECQRHRPMLHLKNHKLRTHLCYSPDRTSPPGTSCCRCGHTHSVRRSRLVAGRTCCSWSRSSARRSWGGPGSGTEPQGRYGSGPATDGSGWSSPSGRPSRSLPRRRLHINNGFRRVRQETFIVKELKAGSCVYDLVPNI